MPFCTRKCHYCDFVSYPLAAAGGREGVGRYLDALAWEAEWYAAALQPAPVETVYVGGGTPSLLTPTELELLFATLVGAFGPWAAGAEVTVEANPGTVDEAKLETLLTAGVNRLSVGVQSFDAELLRRVGRFSTPAQVEATVGAARAFGFTNLSLDLILGFPGQTPEGLGEDLRRAVDLAPEHLSVYALTLEGGTPLAHAVAEGRTALPGEEVEAALFDLVNAFLPAAGFHHYEVSNFARPGYEARHNLAYWHNEDYLALGPAAAGHAGLLRYHNAPGHSDYARLLTAGRPRPGSGEDPAGSGGDFPLSPAAVAVEHLTVQQARGETAFLGLRLLTEGLDRAAFRRRFGIDPLAVWREEVARLARQGLLEVTERALRLTPAGLPVANLVFSAFV